MEWDGTSWHKGHDGQRSEVSIIAYVIFNFLPCSALRETLTSSDSQIPEEQ